jgi:hypothetical protein
MHIYVCVCIYIYIYTHTYTHTHQYVQTDIFAYMLYTYAQVMHTYMIHALAYVPQINMYEHIKHTNTKLSEYSNISLLFRVSTQQLASIRTQILKTF